MQLAVRLPSLSRKCGCDDPCRLAQCQERPAEGPHEGGASHLRDKVRIGIHVNIDAINNNGLLVAGANDFTKAFGGRVTSG